MVRKRRQRKMKEDAKCSPQTTETKVRERGSEPPAVNESVATPTSQGGETGAAPLDVDIQHPRPPDCTSRQQHSSGATLEEDISNLSAQTIQGATDSSAIRHIPMLPPIPPVEPEVTSLNPAPSLPDWLRQDPLAFANGFASFCNLAAMFSLPPQPQGSASTSVAGNLQPFQEFLATLKNQQSRTNAAHLASPERPSVTSMTASPGVVKDEATSSLCGQSTPVRRRLTPEFGLPPKPLASSIALSEEFVPATNPETDYNAADKTFGYSHSHILNMENDVLTSSPFIDVETVNRSELLDFQHKSKERKCLDPSVLGQMEPSSKQQQILTMTSSPSVEQSVAAMTSSSGISMSAKSENLASNVKSVGHEQPGIASLEGETTNKGPKKPSYKRKRKGDGYTKSRKRRRLSKGEEDMLLSVSGSNDVTTGKDTGTAGLLATKIETSDFTSVVSSADEPLRKDCATITPVASKEDGQSEVCITAKRSCAESEVGRKGDNIKSSNNHAKGTSKKKQTKVKQKQTKSNVRQEELGKGEAGPMSSEAQNKGLQGSEFLSKISEDQIPEAARAEIESLSETKPTTTAMGALKAASSMPAEKMVDGSSGEVDGVDDANGIVVGKDGGTPKTPKLNRELQQLLDGGQSLIRQSTIRQCPPKTELFQCPLPKRATPKLKKKKDEMQACAGTIKKEEQTSLPHSAIDEMVDNLGNIVWAKFGRQCWWPGIITKGMYCALKPAKENYNWIFWFGDHKVSEVAHYNILGFTEEFKRMSKTCRTKLFEKALLEAIMECSSRCDMTVEYDSEILLNWANEGFQVVGRTNHELFTANPNKPIADYLLEYMSTLADRMHNKGSGSPDEIQLQRIENKHRRDDAFDKVKSQEMNITDLCIACDIHSEPVVSQHPLFKGGLCAECKQELMETLFVYGDDGLNFYCVICGNSGEMFVCDNTDCSRVYCTGCVDALLGEKSIAKLRHMDPWLCFLCSEYNVKTHGLIEPKKDWQQNVIQFYQPEHVIQLPTQEFTKHPIRVLSLFDGISTGRHVLDRLGIEVEEYFSCEIDDDALRVAKVRYNSNQFLGDVTRIDKAKLKDIGRIDLVLGASPCNDLSLVNPARKGIHAGTGQLFFEFYRILTEVQLLNQDHHVFWLFENVKTMMAEAKTTISRFLKCEPATWDAKMFSAQKRARYFWGNIPGMYCPPEISQMQNTSNLGSFLTKDCNRTANVSKLRTVTTRSNSLKQGKNDDFFPVTMNGQDDGLWIQELERVFGFPDHFTDVGNLGPGKRQRLLGKAWSVPVVKHLLQPLKQFFVTAGTIDSSTNQEQPDPSTVANDE